MKRRTLLAGLACAIGAVSGCVSDGNADDTEMNRTDGSPPSAPADIETNRPECVIEPETFEAGGEEFERVGTVPYPDPPEELTAEQVTEFAEEHERAYIRHSALCDNLDQNVIRFGYGVDRHWLFEDTESFTVALVYVGGAREGVDENGARWMADLGPTGVVYTVEADRVARVEFHELATFDPEANIENEIPDPVEDGDVVVEF